MISFSFMKKFLFKKSSMLSVLTSASGLYRYLLDEEKGVAV
jgi:hypothetical protein